MINIGHNNSFSNRDLLGYNVVRDGVVIDFTVNTSYDDSNVSSDIEYCYLIPRE